MSGDDSAEEERQRLFGAERSAPGHYVSHV